MGLPEPIKKVINSVGAFYKNNESTIIAGGIITSSFLSTALTFKNAKSIIETIESTRNLVENAIDDNDRRKIYILTIKELAPKIIPIITFQSLAVILTIKQKRKIDTQGNQIKELSDTLSVANQAILSYQAFKNEASKKLGPKKTAQVEEAVGKAIIDHNPQSNNNTVNSTRISEKDKETYANDVYKYWDNFGNRYFYSTKSPSAIREAIHNLSIEFTKGEFNNYDNLGTNRVTYNDIFELIDPKLVLHPMGDTWGWIDSDHRNQDPDERFIDVNIAGEEDPYDPDHMVWFIGFNGGNFRRY